MTVTRTNQNSDQINLLYQQLEVENRSKRYNFRIRDLPESYTDTQAAVSDLMQTLIPDEPDHKLEVDRADRALMALCPNSPPREIIVKPHYYGIQ